MDYWGWRPYVSVGERRRQAANEMAKLKTKGHPVSPVVVEGRTIVKTFWGKAWCENLERYSDFANRLPRGRTYVRNGSVIDLQIAPGEIKALVSGGDIYRVAVKVAPVAKARWQVHLQRLRRRDRFAHRATAGTVLQGRHGTSLPAEDGLFSVAG